MQETSKNDKKKRTKLTENDKKGPKRQKKVQSRPKMIKHRAKMAKMCKIDQKR